MVLIRCGPKPLRDPEGQILMQRIISKKVKLVSLAATAIVAVSVATAFAAPVLQPGTTVAPHGARGTCTGCHTYATPPVVTPPVVTPPGVTPPVVTPPSVSGDHDAHEAAEHHAEKAHKKSRAHKHAKKASHKKHQARSASHRERD
jgi:hypothetical protein